ncbi:hypothetical protein AYO43_00050 [Nitrospira sp. SCGC AG-212-E16]|nr:hypothetical protein AYO43_00050 [Nitrospira sp. SCGC AG-212-E16]
MPRSHVWVFLLLASLSVADELNAATYYVACDTGHDANEGLSELNAWQSASKVSRFNFTDGDKILFKRGCTWEDVSIKIAHSVDFEAYGDAATPPQLMGVTSVRSWSNLNSRGIFYTQAAIEAGIPSPKEILIVHDEKHGRFYDRVRTLELLDTGGKFFHDVTRNTLYLSPLEGANLQHDIHISSKPHILEFQQVDVERVVVDGLQLSFANEYAIGFWYQSSGTRNGSLKVVNCTFIGNAYQAIHIGGTNSFRDVEILDNTITANGNEGIYIGYIGADPDGQVVTNRLRISRNSIGGQGFGWRSDGPASAANGDGIDIKKGVAAAIIDNNTIFDLSGLYGIGTQSSNVVIEKNTIRDIHMRDAPPESGIAAIMIDAYESKGPTIVRGNTLNIRSANGVVIRGHAERRPRFEIYDNQISVQEPYFPFAFTSQNITNTLITRNRTTGGRAGLWVLRPCCPPANVEFHNNDIRDVSVPLVAAQDVSAGVRVYSNFFCFKGAVDADQKNAVPNNTFSSDCTALRRINPPQHIQVR